MDLGAAFANALCRGRRARLVRALWNRLGSSGGSCAPLGSIRVWTHPLVWFYLDPHLISSQRAQRLCIHLGTRSSVSPYSLQSFSFRALGTLADLRPPPGERSNRSGSLCLLPTKWPRSRTCRTSSGGGCASTPKLKPYGSCPGARSGAPVSNG